MRTTILVSSVFVAALLAGSAAAQPFLNGGLVYIAGGAGGANSGGGYEFDSLGAGNAQLTFNGLYKTAVPLALGQNVFALQVAAGFGPPDPAGLGLFFSDNSTLFNDFGHKCDLVTYVTQGGFAMAQTGASVPTLGSLNGLTPYSGATSFESNGFSVTVTDYSFVGLSGSLTLTVTAVPAPGAAALLGLGGLFAGRRRR